MTGSNVDLIELANSSRRRSPRFRLLRSIEPHGASDTSTLTDARSWRMLAPDLASRGPKTVADTMVRPCVICAAPSAALSCEPPSWMAMDLSSYCLRPSTRKPPALRSSNRDYESNATTKAGRQRQQMLFNQRFLQAVLGQASTYHPASKKVATATLFQVARVCRKEEEVVGMQLEVE